MYHDTISYHKYVAYNDHPVFCFAGWDLKCYATEIIKKLNRYFYESKF